MGEHLLRDTIQNCIVLLDEELESLSNKDLINVTKALENRLRYLKIENGMFEDYLEENDSSYIQATSELFGRTRYQSFLKGKQLDSESKVQMEDLVSILHSASYKPRALALGIDNSKINVNEKMEIYARVTESAEKKMRLFKKSFNRDKKRMLVELEEFAVRHNDIAKCKTEFEDQIVQKSSDVSLITNRIPAEKFVKFLKDWHRHGCLLLEKLRIKVVNQKVNLRKLREQYDLKVTLRSEIEAVDLYVFETQLSHFKDNLNEKNGFWIETKTILGTSNRQVAEMKNKLMGQIEECNRFQRQIEESNVALKSYMKEEEELTDQIEIIRKKEESIKRLVKSRTCPSVQEYLNARRQLEELRLQQKTWNRRENIQKNALGCYKAILRQCKAKNKGKKLLEECFSATLLRVSF